MNSLKFKVISFVLVLGVLMFGSVLSASAQDYPKPKTSTTKKQSNAGQHDMKDMNKAGQAGMLTARLIDPEMKAKGKAATVEVTVKGIALIDPAKVGERPRKGQGHLHYQVDGGPVIATTTTKLSFHGLSSGQHTIVVMLAANDHSPLGPQQTLTVTVP